MYLILVTGSRKFNDRILMKTVLQEYIDKYPNTKFRHGEAEGADQLVDELFLIRVERRFKPKYSGKFDKHDREAPKRRNIEMLVTSPIPNRVVAFFYKTETGGTLHTVNNAIKRHIPVDRYYQ